VSIKALDPTVPTSNSNAGLGDNELRALKAAIQTCFPELEGVITNSSGAGDNPPKAADFSSLFTRIEALENATGPTIPAGIPLGMIAYWNSTYATIPAGWVRCNGGTTNGVAVPDMEGYFVVSATPDPPLGTGGGTETQSGGASSAGTTGSTSLSMAQMPTALSTSVKIKISEGSSGQNHYGTSQVAGMGGSSSAYDAPMVITGANGAGHTHTLGAASAHTHTQIRPPWIALIPICYVGT